MLHVDMFHVLLTDIYKLSPDQLQRKANSIEIIKRKLSVENSCIAVLYFKCFLSEFNGNIFLQPKITDDEFFSLKYDFLTYCKNGREDDDYIEKFTEIIFCSDFNKF